MPSRNVLKVQAPESFYHVYVRGINKMPIFIDDKDYLYFLYLFDRYLSDDSTKNVKKYLYPNYLGKIDIHAYCLMQNHFHLLIYQFNIPYMQKFMHSIMTSYSRYFNLRHKRSGPVFESRYKAVRIDNESFLQHISRYIHLNPKKWQSYCYSSLQYYANGNSPEWMKTNIILEQFNSTTDYINYLTDYEDVRDNLKEIKSQLIDE